MGTRTVSDDNIQDKAHHLLTEWHQAVGHKARVETVLQALADVQRQSIIDNICHKIKDDRNLCMLCLYTLLSS